MTDDATLELDVTEEVRVAMALNGGVSLAVWMGGCAVELDAARRAHLGAEPMEAVEGTPPPTRTIYNALCRAFHRELVIDLMSGSSAGGINGGLLAAAIHRGRRLHPDYIRDKWICLGDFQELLRDLGTEAPTSLMNGERFRRELETTFKELLPSDTKADGRSDAESRLRITGVQRERLDDDEQALSTAVKLEVTATDVLGQERRFRDEWGEELIAREYRQSFKFSRREDFRPEWLADAARASASFPLAFEPCKVRGERLALSGDRWLIDGGLLDNAPIQSVLDLIPARPSRRRVRRYVCYVNADPPLDPSFLDAAAARQAARTGAAPAGGPADARTAKPAPGVDTRDRAPQLHDVLGYMVNLPRKATFVDHLNAIQRAAGRSLSVEKANESLLALDREILRRTADALLPAYRSRRRMLALEEHLDRRPADVRCADARVRAVADGDLPWIPTSLAPPGAGEWGWGVRAAQRILHLMLDLIRHASDFRETERPDPEVRARLNDARDRIYDRIGALERIHDAVTGDAHIRRLVVSLADRQDPATMTLCALRCRMRDPSRDGAIHRHVRETAAEVFALEPLLGLACDNVAGMTAVPVQAALFGSEGGTGFDDAHFARFLERTLSIEVIRRAFAADDEIDTDQPLAFAQITPCAPTLLATGRPIAADGAPATPGEKLTGTRWGHFAGFYRRSWRANDFMWGRLDAAVRIVDMLVDGHRADWIKSNTDTDPAAVLACALWPRGGCADEELAPARRLLIAEVLSEAADVPPTERYRAGDWREEQLKARLDDAPEALHEALRAAIAEDLTRAATSDDAPPPRLTRALCVRAAQLEVLCHELPKVVALSVEDLTAGTSTKPLDPVHHPWTEVIAQLRTNPPLPERLGSGDAAEQGSALMIRTATRSALVAFAALRATKLPLGGLISLPSTLLLPAAGIVARRREWAVVVALAFWLVALFAAGRLLSVDPAGPASSWFPVVITYLAVAGLLSVCAVPVWRIWRGAGAMRFLTQGGWLAALLGTGILAAAGIAVAGDATVWDVALQRGSDAPPTWTLVLAAASLGLVRWLPKRLRRFVDRELRASWRGPLSLWRLVPWFALAVWAVSAPLQEHLFARHHALGWAAVSAPLAAALGYVIFSGRRWSALRRARAAARSSPKPARGRGRAAPAVLETAR
ncbi:MAG TPA: DUF3376 domain-containing protein [Solirubrobacteraceae bacterium]|nr:DUF3376 domain-containing protein [Solirubrobacteraceae bacterium]